MKRTYVTTCGHCWRRLHAPSEEKLEAQKERHARNCATLKREIAAPIPDATSLDDLEREARRRITILEERDE